VHGNIDHEIFGGPRENVVSGQAFSGHTSKSGSYSFIAPRTALSQQAPLGFLPLSVDLEADGKHARCKDAR